MSAGSVGRSRFQWSQPVSVGAAGSGGRFRQSVPVLVRCDAPPVSSRLCSVPIPVPSRPFVPSRPLCGRQCKGRLLGLSMPRSKDTGRRSGRIGGPRLLPELLFALIGYVRYDGDKRSSHAGDTGREDVLFSIEWGLTRAGCDFAPVSRRGGAWQKIKRPFSDRFW